MESRGFGSKFDLWANPAVDRPTYVDNGFIGILVPLVHVKFDFEFFPSHLRTTSSPTSYAAPSMLAFALGFLTEDWNAMNNDIIFST